MASAEGERDQGLDDLRAGLHGMWAAVAGGWGENADFIDSRGTELTARLLDEAALQPGERVLELACGPGGVGLAAAERVGPEGEVVLSDVAAEMTAIAAERAKALGLANVSTRVLDLERIDEPDDSYDVVLCREGLMLVPEPAVAATEIKRVLRPGGRFAISVWGPRESNPWLGVLLDSVGEQLGGTFPPPGVPGPFALDDPGRLAAVLAEGGLSAVEVAEVPVPYRADSFEDWWSQVTALAGPIANVLAAQPEESVEAIRARALGVLGEYQMGDGVEIPGVSLLASGRRE
jgi:SAM-dependent methyltransferase